MNNNLHKIKISNELINVFTELQKKNKPQRAVVDQNILALIGGVIVSFQNLESSMADCLAIFYKLGSIGRDVFITKLSFKNILDLLGATVAELKDNNKNPNMELRTFSDNLQLLINESSKVEEIRNKLVHSKWVTKLGGVNDGVAHTFKRTVNRKKGVNNIFTEYTTTELETLIDWIKKIDICFNSIYLDILERNIK